MDLWGQLLPWVTDYWKIDFRCRGNASRELFCFSGNWASTIVTDASRQED